MKRLIIALALVLSTLACGPSTLSKLHDNLNKASKALNTAAKTNRQFYENGTYGPVGSQGAVEVRQKGAKAIHDGNEHLIKALELAKELRKETFEQGKLAVLQELARASATLRTGNPTVDLVLQGVVTIINNIVVLIESFKSADLRYVLPELQKIHLERITA